MTNIHPEDYGYRSWLSIYESIEATGNYDMNNSLEKVYFGHNTGNGIKNKWMSINELNLLLINELRQKAVAKNELMELTYNYSLMPQSEMIGNMINRLNK